MTELTSLGPGVVVFGDPVGSDPLIATLRIAAFGLIVISAALIPGPVRAARETRDRNTVTRRTATA